jgi:hypothetical protein
MVPNSVSGRELGVAEKWVPELIVISKGIYRPNKPDIGHCCFLRNTTWTKSFFVFSYVATHALAR